jgi:hypothetical protein
MWFNYDYLFKNMAAAIAVAISYSQHRDLNGRRSPWKARAPGAGLIELIINRIIFLAPPAPGGKIRLRYFD